MNRRRRRRRTDDSPSDGRQPETRQPAGRQPEHRQPANVDHRKGHRSHLRDGFPRDGGNRQPWRRRTTPAEEAVGGRIPVADRPGPRIWVEEAR